MNIERSLWEDAIYVFDRSNWLLLVQLLPFPDYSLMKSLAQCVFMCVGVRLEKKGGVGGESDSHTHSSVPTLWSLGPVVFYCHCAQWGFPLLLGCSLLGFQTTDLHKAWGCLSVLVRTPTRLQSLRIFLLGYQGMTFVISSFIGRFPTRNFWLQRTALFLRSMWVDRGWSRGSG